jgi:hypothetical protein
VGTHPEPAVNDSPGRPQLEQLALEGPWGGPTHRYRGARIECMKGGHVCGLVMEGHPLDGPTFGGVGTITPLVDGWADAGRLPDFMRAVQRQGD